MRQLDAPVVQSAGTINHKHPHFECAKIFTAGRDITRG
jgi:hypothetical protein